jgi:hypothetical protein
MHKSRILQLFNVYWQKCKILQFWLRDLRWAGHVARMEEGKSPFKILTD